MKKLFFAAVLFFLTSNSAFAELPKILKLTDLQPGTHAVGFSVFRGLEPEPFDVLLNESVFLDD
ncbi:hypothetical protein KW791_03620, partial [Candidatus Parcubacteria bacterium]|nr:hypothetical protein [Candidatus Parcubacteria bacterium]